MSAKIKAAIYEALHYARHIRTVNEEPSGNYPQGRDLEEYRLADGRYLQVAWNRQVSSESTGYGRLDAWHFSQRSESYWMI